MANEVNDKPAERGIMVNNILTALILASILWVGNTILDLKDAVANIAAGQSLNQARIDGIGKTVMDHEGRIRMIERKEYELHQ